MITRLFVLALLASTALAGCADAQDEGAAAVADEALTSAPPSITVHSDEIRATGVPVLFGLPAGADGSKIREIVFVETSTPDGPDTDGRARFPEVRYQKRLVVAHLGGAVEVLTPSGGVADGAMLIAADTGKPRTAVVASADREVKKLWDQHADGRFTIRMFPSSGGTVVRTANGFTATIRPDGALVATDGQGSSYSAAADLATLEESSVTIGGEETVSRCTYRLELKEAAVLSVIANAALFHVERTLVSRSGDIACTRRDDRFVLGMPAIH